MRRARFLLIALTTAVLVACAGQEAAEPPPRPALVIEVGAGGPQASAFAGEIRARHEPSLAFQVGGKIARRQAEVGDRVRKGQVLAELDPVDLALQLEAGRAQQAAAEADLALASAELERHRGLFERQLISRSLFETREAAQQAAEARLRQAKAQVAAFANQAGYAQLRASSSGVIAQRLAEAGQVVAAGQPVFVLAVDGEREVAISLPEQHGEDFTPGRELWVELWATPGQRIKGRLREVAPAADPLTRTYAARVELQEGQGAVELGQSARVYALANGRRELGLPLSALHAKDGQPAVWRVDRATGRVQLVPVQSGAYTESGVPIAAGLKEGDWVVAAGVHLLLEGQRVLPVDRDNRPLPLVASAQE
ncbi:MAG TPA: efflux RND transporter periplasmic adaptor subunit [Arenimonas sp.]|nr:efflux RND transporter periplasmic adaptor subunit [Arenimonas sp.]